MFISEVKFVSAYRSVRQKERITLKSPKAPRRLQPLSANTQQSAPVNGTSKCVIFDMPTFHLLILNTYSWAPVESMTHVQWCIVV